MSTIIRAESVTKTFGDTIALDDVSVAVESGQCVGMLGPNGAGKTTFLTLVEGLRAPTRGSVELFGGDPKNAASRVRLGSTPQATALPESLRVSEVLRYVAAHYPAPATTEQIVDEFQLAPFLGKQCGSLSGGQQRRVAVALAFIGNPELVLLDEPTTGMDVDARRVLWDAVRARHASGCAIVVTSHHLEEIEALAERVIVIDQGTVRADDDLDTIIRGVARQHVRVRGVTEDQVRRIEPDALVSIDDAGRLTAVVGDSDALVRQLVRNDLPFEDLTVRGATLEEAFLTITKGGAA